MTPSEDYRPRQLRNWLVFGNILRLQIDRHHLFGLSWEVIQIYDPDCGCRSCTARFAPLPMVVLQYEWYWDNPICPDVIRNRAGRDPDSPSIADLRGIDPDFTGGMDAAEYVRKMRDAE